MVLLKAKFRPALCLLLVLLAGCAPPPAGGLEAGSRELPSSGDLRGADLRGLDLTGMEEALFSADFDTCTRWPEDLPGGFDPAALLEEGKNPGLGLRALHQRGITGKGVGIAIIDQTLLTEHQEYADRLTALNETLPEGERIRVISMSVGWMPEDRGAAELEAAVARARAAGVAVVCVNSRDPLLEPWMGMGRRRYGSYDNRADLRPGAFWEELLYSGEFRGTDGPLLLVPMDRRTTASPAGEDAYTCFPEGGMSWVCPYVAGLYALACQVRPEVTYEEFLDAAQATARPVSVWKDEKTEYPYGKAVDPAALVEALAA